MNDPHIEAIEARVKNLELDSYQQTQAIAALQSALEIERQINQQQTESIARRQQVLIRTERQTRRGLEVLVVALLGFFGFCLIILAGLKLEGEWGTFALPENFFESGALVVGVAAGAKYVLDRSRETRETPPAYREPPPLTAPQGKRILIEQDLE
ncbi:MAG: hypothetical protein HC895_08240 [Leptolyngbyaceae cyanobacterium SM1_3_5]|nr:hypothetical protein [Leptolyngbyaceae cyanobacterium SM1_3_5]